MNIFDEHTARPMLIAEAREPFDSEDHIFELKFDGIRCLAYLDDTGTDLRNKRNIKLGLTFPELQKLHKQVGKRCILDGELVAMVKGKPDFYEVQRRSLMTNRMKIEHAMKQCPIHFIAYDILYLGDENLTMRPLLFRKSTLNMNIRESERLAESRIIEKHGIAFYNLVAEQQLEGIVAKRKDSLYHMGKRSKDWIKIKWLKDEDFVIVGYILKSAQHASLVLAQYQGQRLVYKGHVTSGVTARHVEQISHLRTETPPFGYGNDYTIWIKPEIVGVVQWMPNTKDGLRQPVFKGFRDDVSPQECIAGKSAP